MALVQGTKALIHAAVRSVASTVVVQARNLAVRQGNTVERLAVAVAVAGAVTLGLVDVVTDVLKEGKRCEVEINMWCWD